MKKRGKTLISILIALSMLFLYVPLSSGAQAEPVTLEEGTIEGEMQKEETQLEEDERDKENEETFKEETGAASQQVLGLDLGAKAIRPVGGPVVSPVADVTVGNQTDLETELAGAQPSIGLANDMGLDAPLVITRDVVIEGNGKKLTSSAGDRHIIVLAGTLTLENLTIEGNNTPAVNNGGIEVRSGGALVLNSGSAVTRCTANHGGGIENYGSMTVKSGTSITNNYAINGNSTQGYGGGIYNEGMAQITGGTISGNSAESTGGGICSFAGTLMVKGAGSNKVQIQNNTATHGAGLCSDDTQLNMDYVRVYDNAASSNGSGIRVSNTASFLIDHTELVENVESQPITFGGGAYVLDASGVIQNSLIEGNQANSGGGIRTRYAEIDIKNTKILGNESTTTGGGVGCDDHTTINLDENTLVDGNRANSGAGIYVWLESKLESYATITNNVASSHGGGVGVVGLYDASPRSEFIMLGGEISKNRATGNGGGINTDSYGNIVLKKGKLVENTAGGVGGGMVICGDLNMEEEEILFQQNEANNGGAIYFGDGHSNQITFGKFKMLRNRANNDGGGIYSNNVNLKLTGGLLESNYAWNNGAGIYLHNDMAKGLNASNVTLIDGDANKGGGIFSEAMSIELDKANLSENYAEDSGGGILAYQSQLKIKDSIFQENKTPGEGGAIRMQGTAALGDISATKFIQNEAENSGGAVALDWANAKFGNCDFTNNKAETGNGGAITLYTGSGTGLEVSGGTFRENSATGGNGGAINSNDHTYVRVNDSKFYDNLSQQGYIMPESYRSVYNTYVSNVTEISYGFPAAYNNHDISYTGGLMGFLHRVTFLDRGVQVKVLPGVLTGSTITEPTETLAPNPGYTMTGWKERVSGQKWNFSADTVDSDTVLEAIWEQDQYTVTFNSNGGSPVSPQTRTYGQHVNQPNVSRAGYTLVEWRLNSTSGPMWNFNSDTVTGNMTLYAIWQQNPSPVTYYTVTFNSNGGTNVDPQRVSAGSLLTAPSAPTRTGYSFEGWYTASTGGSLWNFSSGRVYGDMTLYARWNANRFTVTFDGNGAQIAANPSIKTVIYPARSIDSLPSAPSRTGYTFDGWYTRREGGVPFGTSSTVNSNMTVYAHWGVQYFQLSFDTNGANTPAPTEQSVAFGALAQSVEDPQKDGNVFLGWNTAKDGSGNSWNFGSNTMPASNVTLYAQWDAADAAIAGTSATNGSGQNGGNDNSNGQGSSNGSPTLQIGENEIPLFGFGHEYWALSNMLLALIGLLLSLVLLVLAYTKQKAEMGVTNKRWRIVAMALAVVSVGLFLFTEDLGTQMALVDEWTIVMVVLFVAQIGAWILSRKQKALKQATQN